jgi:hypothetical protein
VPGEDKRPKLQEMRSSSSPLPDLPIEIQELIMEHVRRLELEDRERLCAEATTRLDGLLDEVVSCMCVQTTSTHEWIHSTMLVAPFDIWDLLVGDSWVHNSVAALYGICWLETLECTTVLLHFMYDDANQNEW